MSQNKLDEFLNNFPDIEDFYKNYWGKKPFIVRNAINAKNFDELIDAPSLASLSMEEDVKSRIVITTPEGDKWICDHGPFKESKFVELDKNLNDKNWSLIVQNVEQYHTDTAKLLQSFDFSPSWLMDDIMVSYSTVGGSVGPHTDSYHVFLVQGMGKREWKIGHSPVIDEKCIENSDLKILKDGFNGEEIEVSIGDVIYLPPNFAHEGITTENSLTFSVGFLGPKMSEMIIEYGHYLEQIETEKENKRFNGNGLDGSSSGFIISPKAQKYVQDDIINTIKNNSFSKWLAAYFSIPTYEDPENIPERYEQISSSELLKILKDGDKLYKPEHIKISVTKTDNKVNNLAIYGSVIAMNFKNNEEIIRWLNQNQKISINDVKQFNNEKEFMNVITHLYNKNILFFEGEDLTIS